MLLLIKFIVIATCAMNAMALESSTVDDYVEEVDKLCANIKKIDEYLLLKLFTGDFNFEDELTKRAYFCYYYNHKIMNANGDFNRDTFVSQLGDAKHTARLTQYFDSCLGKGGATKFDAAWNMAKCLNDLKEHDEVPEVMKFETEKCLEKTGVSKKFLWKVFRRNVDFEDEKMNDFTFCLLRQKNVIDDNGIFIREQEKYATLWATCLKNVEKANPSMVWNDLKCLIKMESRILPVFFDGYEL